MLGKLFVVLEPVYEMPAKYRFPAASPRTFAGIRCASWSHTMSDRSPPTSVLYTSVGSTVSSWLWSYSPNVIRSVRPSSRGFTATVLFP